MNRETFIDENKTILNTDFYLHLLSCENENTNLKQALNEIKEVVKGYMPTNQSVCKAMDEIEKIIDKVGGEK